MSKVACVHDDASTKESNGVMFVNTAIDINDTPVVIDYHHLTVGSTSSVNTDPTDQPSVHPVRVIDKKCNAHQLMLNFLILLQRSG